MTWTCPDCGRTFGGNRQSHECAPALSLEHCFATGQRALVQLRPKTKWVAMSFPFSRRLTHPRIIRKPIASGRKVNHFVNLTSAADVDDELQGWLTESFHEIGWFKGVDQWSHSEEDWSLAASLAVGSRLSRHGDL